MVKKTGISIIAALLISTPSMATTRAEIQTALDLIRFMNIVNDLYDSKKLIIKGDVAKRDGTSYTIEERKKIASRLASNVKNYNTRLSNYLSDTSKRQVAINGLKALGVNISSIESDLIKMKSVVSHIETNIITATTEQDLDSIGDYINNNISELPLVRKSQ